MRWPDFTARARAIDTASVRPRTVSASAAGKIRRQVSGSNEGDENDGIPDGNAPTAGTLAVPLVTSA